jgi:hypothetical protein
MGEAMSMRRLGTVAVCALLACTACGDGGDGGSAGPATLVAESSSAAGSSPSSGSPTGGTRAPATTATTERGPTSAGSDGTTTSGPMTRPRRTEPKQSKPEQSTPRQSKPTTTKPKQTKVRLSVSTSPADRDDVSVSVTPAGGSYPPGTSVTIQPVPLEAFGHWEFSGPGGGKNPCAEFICTFTITADTVVTGVFLDKDDQGAGDAGG